MLRSKSADWFRHRGADNSDAGVNRGEITSTGRMLSAPFGGPAQPSAPPPRFNGRAQTMYHASNPFSSHDNRHTTQDKGEYFGDGRDERHLGRRLRNPVADRLHNTGEDFLKHHSLRPVHHDYHTTFMDSFSGRPTDHPPTARRFPRSRPEPPSGPQAPLSTTTSDWFKDPLEAARSTQPSTRVLAISQQPYPAHNAWKYSFQGLPRVYPPYTQQRSRPGQVGAIDNVLNHYGAAFSNASVVKAGMAKS